LQPKTAFGASTSARVFRIMASDYAESTIVPSILRRLRDEAPGVVLDIMTPSDVSYLDVEQGKVDMIINRFDSIPQSFHKKLIWSDSFTCLFSERNPIREDFNLETYLQAQHVWVSKTGMGVGVGIDPEDVRRLGWVDEALGKLGRKRRITIFTRHYHAAMLLAELKDLIVTIPTRAARLQQNNPRVVTRQPPFDIPNIDLEMAWSPLLQNNPGHQWMRKLIAEEAEKQH
jgi:DNA-binding transcriptional LysR family regulator